MGVKDMPTLRATDRAPLAIEILGPLRVTVGGMSIEPPQARTWQLLALFAVYADHVLPVHVMMEELWPDGPPPGALSELHRRVADLQDRLARADELSPHRFGSPAPRRGAGTRLVATSGGYRFDCSQATLDVRQFWRDSGAGFRALSADDAHTAARRLSSALHLWTGNALANVPLGPRLRREVEQLSMARARAAEQWLEAESRLGRPDEATALAGITAQAPARGTFQVPAAPARPHRTALGAEAVEMFEWLRGTQHRPAPGRRREEWRLDSR